MTKVDIVVAKNGHDVDHREAKGEGLCRKHNPSCYVEQR